MTPEKNQLTRFLSRLSTVIAVLVGISLPIGYGLVAYNNLAESLVFKAQIKAHGQGELITTMPGTWMYAENRIQGMLKREPLVLDNELLQLYDSHGALITSTGRQVSGPKLQRSYPLYDIDRIVGKVVISTSLSGIIDNTVRVALGGFALGFLVLVVMRHLPIRQLRRISDELYEEKERAVITLHSISDAVLRTDTEARLLFLNSAGEKMLGRSLEEIRGKQVSEILHFTDNSTGAPIASALVKALSSRKAASCNGRSMLEVADTIKIAIEERAAPIFTSNGKLSGGVLCLRDVSIARDYLERRSWEAFHDSLTGLLNRRAFENSIATAIDRAHNSEQHYVLCYMDLDRFKVVNDSCGHAAGDELLTQLTRMMQSKVRETDILARLGGDEFGLLLEGCSSARGQIIANELLAAVEEFQFPWEGQIYTVGISIGLTTITSESLNTTEVLGEADSACYWAKEKGRHQVCVYLASDMDLAARRSEIGWVGRIASALKENRFVLYHQTYRTLNPDAGMRLHMEVLLRMVDENGDIILPALFLPAAERYDLVQDIDRWVINKVFAGFHLLTEAHKETSMMVNINLSGASINSRNLLKFIKEKVAEFNIDPESLCFEVTETVAVKNLRAAIEFINECKKIGIKFALDDFGTGTSSFGYLKNLPVDYLKIDGSFVQNLEKDAVDREMTGTINRIGHLMGKLTVAEFAENQSIVAILGEMGVDFAQGYGVCLPKPLFPDIKSQV
jgi:diguanylate cyclase (GGDEF)-like protein/PAS domain S-box-containing protein